MDRGTGRLSALLVTMTMLLGAVAAPPVTAAPVTRETPIHRIAVIGDSYTNGTDEGGLGAQAWPVRAQQTLSRQGLTVAADVAAEGRAGYDTVGNRGSVFRDLVVRAVRPDDTLVVFYGSRNDRDVPPDRLSQAVRDTLQLARGAAPQARLLVISTPWPTADVPPDILGVRDVLAAQARAMGASFVDPIAARWFVDQPWLIGSDGVHPTDAGHAYMADRIAPLMAGQLPRTV
ncbi:GDSL lipase [Mycobacterium sp. ACS4331]|uniref:Rv0518 family GDSL lipase n=1 Tax=Mycobacterium sp. ACS4331 TaxID=1834121 RepID=UPI00336A651B